MSSRKGGGPAKREAQAVIVDMREFRSSLPPMLHACGMQVIPVTLEVGDYVLRYIVLFALNYCLPSTK